MSGTTDSKEFIVNIDCPRCARTFELSYFAFEAGYAPGMATRHLQRECPDHGDNWAFYVSMEPRQEVKGDNRMSEMAVEDCCQVTTS